MDFTHHVLADSCQKSEKIFLNFKTLLASWLKYLTYRATEICNHKNILLRTGRRLKDSRVRAHLCFLCPFQFSPKQLKPNTAKSAVSAEDVTGHLTGLEQEDVF